MPLRMLVRAAPFVLGAVAAAIWLRRRAARQREAAAREEKAREEVARLAARRPAPAPPAPAVAARPRTGRFDRPPTGRFERRSKGRFARIEVPPPSAREREPLDIVTVVDDLLLAGAR